MSKARSFVSRRGDFLRMTTPSPQTDIVDSVGPVPSDTSNLSMTLTPALSRPPLSRRRAPANGVVAGGRGRYRTFRLFAALLFFFTFSPRPAHAISDSAGTSNGAFLKIPTDARGVALGPAIVSMAEGTEALRWNPGALGEADSKEVAATQVVYYQGVSIQDIRYVYPLERSAIAASGFYLSPGSLDGRDTLGNSTGDFQFYDLVGTLGYGRQLRSSDEGVEINVGAAFKVVQENIAGEQFQNPALDLGILAAPSAELKLGAALRDLSAGRANFPKELMGGISYTFFQRATGAFALRLADDAPARYSLGGEFRFPELEDAVLRAGYQNHDALDDSTDSAIPAFRNASVAGITMGAGFGYQPPQFKTLRFELDYAMAPFGTLGISHTITIKAKW